MVTPPPGVTVFDPVAASKRARRGVIASLFGSTKSGKSHIVARAPRPLYIVFMDPNASLDAHLLQAQSEGLEGDVFPMVIQPTEYEALSQDRAQQVVEQIEGFARWARMQAATALAEDKPTGTFVVDGTRVLKGYYEKAILGESATLGFRPKRGSKAPSTFEYAQSNDALRDFIQGFATDPKPLDLLMTWEGRPEWIDTVDENGRKGAKRTGNYRSTMPDSVPFAVQAQIQTLMAVRQRVENGQMSKYIEPMILFDWNSYNKDLYGRMMPAMSWEMIRAVLLGSVPNVEDVLVPTGETVVRAGESVED